jgi:two-component sensor histidine kinase
VEFDNNGRMVSVHKFIQDVTEETLAKESALELQREVGIIQKGSKIALVHYQNGEFYWTSEIYDILEIDNPDDYPKHVDLLDLFLVPEEKGSFKRKMAEVSCDNSSFTLTGTIKTVKGNIKYVEGYQEFQFDDEGEIVEFVAFIHEITDKVSRQKELEDLSEERKILLLEIQDRIKNNLQLLKSYLNLDNRYYDNNPEYVIERTQKRLNVMSLSYEIIYNSENVSNLNLSDLLESLITKLYLEENIGNFKNIRLHYNIDSSIYVDINDFVNLAYIVASLANNTYKHAFPGEKSGNFYIEAENLGENIVLKVWDDGVGLSEDIELSEISNMGFLIIINLINQLEGEYKILEDVPGFGVELTFKS